MATVDFSKEADEKQVYPAVHHFKIIGDVAVIREEILLNILAGRDVRHPLTKGRASSGGKYVTYDVSIYFENRAAHHLFHEEMKAAPGVRILL